ncbi:MFS transporter [Novosphingobium sp.]|jgi:MFS family permease|uniref:MFS transporter n=1 Tax=Novosphingobium sp. TaxID=1874826 RepID=UPI0022BAF899|nr:MFS transporter [Novosphingobium sp.]MCZ8019928.1 MFS transporter [Novosphingobium sp.]MCZ8033558.1 MFS transporter [Novosphingobium sp.]MCZ8050914.1 MFS transporter [Novosphingobium sp.]MCZ8059260.1 MFS transporter [Novosphingobium sp.]MCZ8231098.1 MFS transporter [Novosphingobium sp.]
MTEATLPKHHAATGSERKVILASSLGTVFEWYDFYLYGLLATVISAQFFSGVNETTGFIFALGAFAAGFAVRPFGALVFGRLGDLVGRKYTFLVTMGLMGFATFTVGILPTYASIGVAAPIMLVILRLLQGLALGGEYGGAATYVAEHAPNNKRGLYTSFIQTTATLGLFAALLVVIGTRMAVGEEAFKDWGWRVPFLISVVLLGVSLWIRMQLQESPVFQKMKEEGTNSKAPIAEAFGQWKNARFALIALLGAVAGQAVVWYTGQFYALFFLEKTLMVDGATTNILIAIALAIGTPFFIVFGWLSDRIGRKPIILAGCALAVFTYFPAFHALTEAANPALARAQAMAPVTVIANDGDCSFQFDPVGKNRFDSKSCDIAKSFLAKGGISYAQVDAPAGMVAQVTVGGTTFTAPDPAKVTGDERKAAIAAFQQEVKAALAAAGYPAKADPDQINKPLVIAILTYLVLLVTAVYGPIAALLVELFPTRIRYTAMSLPYHIGNGWFGGFLPTTAFAMVAATGDIYYGLWYPIVVAGLTVVIGLLFLPETFRRNIDD